MNTRQGHDRHSMPISSYWKKQKRLLIKLSLSLLALFLIGSHVQPNFTVAEEETETITEPTVDVTEETTQEEVVVEETPEITETPEVTEPTPEVLPTSEETIEPTPEVTTTPEVTPTPEVTATPEMTPTPGVTPEVTEEPTPEVTPTPTPETEEEKEETEEVEEVEEEYELVLTGDNGSDAHVTVTALSSVFKDAEGKIPDLEGYSLSVIELDQNSDIYKQYYDAAFDTINEGTPEEVTKNITFARFFDISILDQEGNIVEPSAPVKVEITYDTPIEVKEEDELHTVHFVEETKESVETKESAEIVNVELLDSEVNTSPEGQAEVVVTFEQDGFSVTGTVVTTETSDDMRYGFPTESGDYVMVVGYNGKYYAVIAEPIDEPIYNSGIALDATKSKGTLVPVTVNGDEVVFDATGIPSSLNKVVGDAATWQYLKVAAVNGYISASLEGNFLVSTYGNPMGGVAKTRSA